MISSQVESFDELQQKMNFEILPEGVRKWDYQNKLVYVFLIGLAAWNYSIIHP